MDRNNVVLVDLQDNAIGEMEKMEAHRKGALHRAFSVFIFNSKGDMLIHQRAVDKYHGGGLWTNACCSHPQFNEQIRESAQQRLQFEMGMNCELTEVFSFVYNTPVENDLFEHEYDHVFTGYTDFTPKPDKREVQDFAWISPQLLKMHIRQQPQLFTYWFRFIMQREELFLSSYLDMPQLAPSLSLIR